MKFKYFLFPDEDIEKVKALRFTKKEQNFLGLEEMYRTSKTTDTNDLLAKIPYDYLLSEFDGNAFALIQFHKKLSDRCGKYRKRIIAYMSEHPEELFDIEKVSDYVLLEFAGVNDPWMTTLGDILGAAQTLEMAGGRLEIPNGKVSLYAPHSREENLLNMYFKAFYHEYFISEKVENTSYVVLTEKGKDFLKWSKKAYAFVGTNGLTIPK